MERIAKLIGGEHRLDHVCRTLREAARSTGAALHGAMHVTCSDESEHESCQVFARDYVRELLPRLRLMDCGAFRTANLGGRHEWGSVPLCENHFVTPELDRMPGAFKLIAVKVNSHVGVLTTPDGVRWGEMKRYGVDSIACGALSLLLGDSTLPEIERLRETFNFEGLDRVALLRDEAKIPPERRLLFAALVQARLQARRVILEIQDHVPLTPTLYLVLPCVTINRPDRDTEIVVGLYLADRRTPEGQVVYQGLGDDPTQFGTALKHGELRIEDAAMHRTREARDHRRLILEQIGEQHRRHAGRTPHHEKLAHVRQEVAERRHHERAASRLLLRTALMAIGEINPVLGALIVFGNGAAAIHHAARAHRLARHEAGAHEARVILDEVHDRVDELPPERVQALLEALTRETAASSKPDSPS
ncbi:hypothetical protein JXA47_15415 [Candidatus Sumerlaeota bacterium]|nr:hypothetical protein [Candidatus Sumerlaeota bacterium]